MSEELVAILTTMDHAKAKLLATLLTSSGIVAEVVASKTTGWGIDVVKAVGQVDVVVTKSDEADARALMAEIDGGALALDEDSKPPAE
jgi:putative heme iron utilization protein